MKRRLIRILALAALGPLVAVLAAGLFSSKEYSGSNSKVLDAPLDKAWNMLSDVEGLPKRNSSIRSIELLVKKDGRAIKWREHLAMGSVALIEVTDCKERQRLQWTMLESSFGMTGTWTFELRPQGAKTEISLAETSLCEGFMTRAALALAGRDSNIKRMLGDFEEALK